MLVPCVTCNVGGFCNIDSVDMYANNPSYSVKETGALEWVHTGCTEGNRNRHLQTRNQLFLQGKSLLCQSSIELAETWHHIVILVCLALTLPACLFVLINGNFSLLCSNPLFMCLVRGDFFRLDKPESYPKYKVIGIGFWANWWMDIHGIGKVFVELAIYNPS